MWEKTNLIIINGYGISSPNFNIRSGDRAKSMAEILIDFNIKKSRGMFSIEEMDLNYDLNDKKNKELVPSCRSISGKISYDRLKGEALELISNSKYKIPGDINWFESSLKVWEFHSGSRLSARIYIKDGYELCIFKEGSRLDDFILVKCNSLSKAKSLFEKYQSGGLK